MNIIDDLIVSLRDQFPLFISDFYCDDLRIGISGENWNFIAMSPWRIVDNEKIIMGCHEKDPIKIGSQIIGESIVGCDALSKSPSLDPRLVLSNGWRVEVFSADTFEPWVFKLPKGFIFIGSGSEERK